jgi:hypothetical protein
LEQNTPQNSWLRWTLVIIVALIVIVLLSVTRMANERYAFAITRIEKTNAPRSLDELYERQTIGPEGMDQELDRIAPSLSENYFVVIMQADKDESKPLFDGDNMTTAGQEVMRGILEKNPNFVEETLSLSRRDHFWSEPRFESLENLREVLIDDTLPKARTAENFLELVAFYETSQNNRDAAAEAAVGILRISNAMSEQPLIEQLNTSFAHRQSALMLLDQTTRSGSVDASLLKQAVILIDESNADASWQAMLETERAVRLTEYREQKSNIWYNTDAATDMLEMIETSQLPPKGSGAPTLDLRKSPRKFVSQMQNGKLFQHLNALSQQRVKIQNLEDQVKAAIERSVMAKE